MTFKCNQFKSLLLKKPFDFCKSCFDASTESSSSSDDESPSQLDPVDEKTPEIYHRIDGGKRGPQARSMEAHFHQPWAQTRLKACWIFEAHGPEAEHGSLRKPMAFELSANSAVCVPHPHSYCELSYVWVPHIVNVTVQGKRRKTGRCKRWVLPNQILIMLKSARPIKRDSRSIGDEDGSAQQCKKIQRGVPTRMEERFCSRSVGDKNRRGHLSCCPPKSWLPNLSQNREDFAQDLKNPAGLFGKLCEGHHRLRKKIERENNKERKEIESGGSGTSDLIE